MSRCHGKENIFPAFGAVAATPPKAKRQRRVAAFTSVAKVAASAEQPSKGGSDGADTSKKKISATDEVSPSRAKGRPKKSGQPKAGSSMLQSTNSRLTTQVDSAKNPQATVVPS